MCSTLPKTWAQGRKWHEGTAFTKVGLISKSFSHWLQSPIKEAKSLSSERICSGESDLAKWKSFWDSATFITFYHDSKKRKEQRIWLWNLKGIVKCMRLHIFKGNKYNFKFFRHLRSEQPIIKGLKNDKIVQTKHYTLFDFLFHQSFLLAGVQIAP